MNQEKIKQILSFLNKAESLMSEEFWDEFNKDKSWSYHQITLILGETKLLINTISDPKKFEDANKLYLKIKEEI